MAREFSTQTASELTGATVRMLDHWARTRLLVPSGLDAKGKGTRRRYTFKDLVSIRTVLDLRRGKCPLGRIRAAVAELKKLHDTLNISEMLARLSLLTDGEHVYILHDDKQAMDVISRQMVWAVPLGRHIIETIERVERLPKTWTECVRISGKVLHISVALIEGQESFSASCHELPGVLEQAADPEEAVSRAIRSIERVFIFMRRKSPADRKDITRAIG